MGRLSRIEQVINDSIDTYAHTKIFPRGLPTYVDRSLRGDIRFAKRTGNNISMLNADNTFFLAEDALIRAKEFIIRHPTDWVKINSIVSIGPGKELHVVDDVIDGVRIHTKFPLSQTFTATENQVLLYASPLFCTLGVNKDGKILQVKSPYKLANGDHFSYLENAGYLNSIADIKISEVTYLGLTADPIYKYLYSIELASPVVRDILDGDLVFQRAFPAYFSQLTQVPNNIGSADPIGPFLMDYLSGNITEGVSVKETFSIKAINRTGAYVHGSQFSYETVNKNFLILDRPLSAYYPLFWELAEGTFRFTPSRLLMRVNDKNLFCCGIRCIPHFEGGRSYRVNLRSNIDCTIRFVFYPNAPQEINLVGGINTPVNLLLPAGIINKIEINILGSANTCEVSMTDWTPRENTVVNLEYAYVAETTGMAKWQGTGLIVKPFFLGMEYLRSRYDSGATFDGGTLWF